MKSGESLDPGDEDLKAWSRVLSRRLTTTVARLASAMGRELGEKFMSVTVFGI